MSTPVLHILLDTNTLLHFKRPDLLDWKVIVQGQQVALLVCPALIDELEAIKIDLKRPAKLRERAHKAIMWLSEMMELPEPIQLAQDVRFVFIAESPTIDFAAHRLSYTVPDDQLIASAIQFRDQTGSTVSFFSNDTGLRLKLRSRGMTGFTLPESERLPDEPDEETKKIRTLEARLASFENRQPKLVLTFADGATHAKVKLRAIDRPEPAQSYFDYKISRDALERYGARHSTYQEKHRAWASQAALRFPVTLVLTNAGSAVATDILLTLTFPDFITALPSRVVLSKPKPPAPPANPLLGLRAPSSPVFIPPVTPYIARPTDAHVNTKENTVTFRISSFVQGRTLNLDPFVLMFDSGTDVQNHSIEYSTSLVEHPEGIRDSLHIILSNDNVEHGK
jgi:PIN domain